MKNIVVFEDYNELDLKPSELLQEYIKRTKADVEKLFGEQKNLQTCPCPGCEGDQSREAFARFGLTYRECESCGTLYVSPRPAAQAINDYYKNAESRKFWREEFSKAAGEKRKEKIIKPRFEWIVESTQEYLPKAKHWVDINTNQYGYVEEMLKTKFFAKKTLLDPLITLDAANGVEVMDVSWWEAKGERQADVVSIFEVADHASDINALLSKTNELLRPGGLCFATAILISGFDLQTLWENAGNLYPPDRLNVLSVEGWQKLAERHGFECVEFSTPGILDVDIVAKALKEDPDFETSRFVKYLVNKKDEEFKKEFQEFLQENLLSSYGRILLRKK